MTKLRTMYDSVTTSDVPKNAAMALGYIDGDYANFQAVKDRLSAKAVVVSVTTGTQPTANVLDRETGDATASQAAKWAKAELAAGRTPTIYCNLAALGEVLRAVARIGCRGKVPVYTAHWTGKKHLCDRTCLDGLDLPYLPYVAATQYADPKTSGGHYDLSVVAAHWPGVDPPLSDRQRALPRWVPFTARWMTRRLHKWLDKPGKADRAGYRDLMRLSQQIDRVHER